MKTNLIKRILSGRNIIGKNFRRNSLRFKLSTLKKNRLLLIAIPLFFSQCKKQDDFLNVKQNLSDVVPTSIADCQQVMDSPYPSNINFPTFGYVTTDNSYLSDANFGVVEPVVRAAYTFQSDVYQGTPANLGWDWNDPYKAVEVANIALDGLSKITPTNNNLTQYNTAKGHALFIRSYMFYALSQLFCKPYDPTTAGQDYGLVLRLTSDVTVKSKRATVKATYDQIITDLKTSIALLPNTPQYQLRPSKPSANALLAKVYLAMGDYKNALTYANASLAEFNTLLDYNDASLVDPTNPSPFPPYPKNPEVSFWAASETGNGIPFSTGTINLVNVDTSLLKMYDANDLRRQVFYFDQGNDTYFKGTYSGFYYAFAGIATNEILLIRAECSARLGDNTTALADLNSLLRKRYKTGTYTDLSISDPLTLLARILQERRKELPFTGQLRWEDLRRLNKDPRFAVTLKRVSNGTTYTLPPNDPRYVFPIPPAEIQLSGIPQNPR